MVLTITSDQHPNYPQRFKDAVRHLFPILGFTPEQIEAFIKKFDPRSDGKSHVIEHGQGRLTFCRYSEDPTVIELEYLIPSNWEERYTLVKEALLRLKHEFLTAEPKRMLYMQINERFPSHAAYYLGLLPELGFSLKPRVTMTAPQDLVRHLTLPELMPDFQEMPHQADQLEVAIDVFVRAYDVYARERSAEERTRKRKADASYITQMYGLEGPVRTWTGIAHENQLIGFSFGDASEERMSVDEVVVVPEFHGKGVGRYLTIRCLQKLHENYGGPDKYFFLGTDRRWSRALKLYHGLGFTIDRVESYATLA
jgi:GNAT superfamily N-acetyltransferase